MVCLELLVDVDMVNLWFGMIDVRKSCMIEKLLRLGFI